MIDDIAWTANLATGRARCLHRHFKGDTYSRAMDMLDRVPHVPVCDHRTAILHARALVELAQTLLAHLEAQPSEPVVERAAG